MLDVCYLSSTAIPPTIVKISGEILEQTAQVIATGDILLFPPQITIITRPLMDFQSHANKA